MLLECIAKQANLLQFLFSFDITLGMSIDQRAPGEQSLSYVDRAPSELRVVFNEWLNKGNGPLAHDLYTRIVTHTWQEPVVGSYELDQKTRDELTNQARRELGQRASDMLGGVVDLSQEPLRLGPELSDEDITHNHRVQAARFAISGNTRLVDLQFGAARKAIANYDDLGDQAIFAMGHLAHVLTTEAGGSWIISPSFSQEKRKHGEEHREAAMFHLLESGIITPPSNRGESVDLQLPW